MTGNFKHKIGQTKNARKGRAGVKQERRIKEGAQEEGATK